MTFYHLYILKTFTDDCRLLPVYEVVIYVKQSTVLFTWFVNIITTCFVK